jgi:rare lipoprotein A
MFFFAAPAMVVTAQANDQNYMRTFRQRGSATRTMRSNDLVGAHPNLPLGTRVLVTNLQNDRQIVVTVTGRIAASGNRVLDLSQVAAIALRMEENDVASVSIEVVRERTDDDAPVPSARQTTSAQPAKQATPAQPARERQTPGADYVPPAPPIAPKKRQ